MNITEICIRRPVLAWMLMAATVLFGAMAIGRLGISQYPDVDFPTITINLTWEGAAPDVMDREVVEQVEESVIQVEGIRSITSVARQGSASITLEMDIERDVDVAMQDTQATVAKAMERAPPDTEFTVSKSNPEDQPIMWVGLSGPYSRAVLADYARYVVKERLQRIRGVGEIFMGGYLERNIRIWIDDNALAQHQLVVADVVTALALEHDERPAGQITAEGREINVRVMGEAFDLETLRRIPVAKGQDGAIIRLGQLARVEDGFEDERRKTRVFGNPVQGMGVKKIRGANAVQVARDVRVVLEELNRSMPTGMEAAVNFDSARFIEDAVHHIELELVAAVILTALVCWMFLGSISSTLNVILAIPMSLLGTVAAIYFLGYTLNTFTLLALSLAVGIVVDDAIMVMENIVRHAEAGKSRLEAARQGTQEIKFAALAATIALIAIFLPVIFVEGVTGRYFMQFGMALSIAVALSYIEAITLAPSRCAQFLVTGREHRGVLGRGVDRAFHGLSRGYRWLLGHSLKAPMVALLVGGGLFVGTYFLFGRIPQEMVPSQDQSRLLIRLQAAVAADLEETDRLMRRVEDLINQRPDVARAMVIIGSFGGTPSVNTGAVFVSLVPKKERRKSQAQIAMELRRQLNGIPGLRANVQDLSQQGFTAQRGNPIELSVRGPDWATLVAESRRIREALDESGLAIDIDSDYKLGMPELRITPDRDRAADIGVPIADIATTVGALVGGLRVGKYTSNGRRVDVRVKVERDQRSSPDDIGRLRVRSESGLLVPLTSVTRQEEVPTLQTITRRDRQRAISIWANPAPGHSQREAIDFAESLRKDLPPGYQLIPTGQSAAFTESFKGLGLAFVLGLAVAYMILAGQFNSFLQPLTVLTIIPLSLAGALGAIYLSGSSLNIFSIIGLVLLAGIVKKNSIILVDYAQNARLAGDSAASAMLSAGPTRLRPILMTSIATAMAAVPAAAGLGEGSETRTPMAIAVIGGISVSTLLSLFVVPSFYVVADRIKSALIGRRKE